VSKTTKTAAVQTTASKDLPFEDALKKLESIVQEMESD